MFSACVVCAAALPRCAHIHDMWCRVRLIMDTQVRPDRSWQVRVRRRGEPQSPRSPQQPQQQQQEDEECQADLRFLLPEGDPSHAGGPGAASGTPSTGGDRHASPVVNTRTADTAATAAGADLGASAPAGVPGHGMEGNNAVQPGACEDGAVMGQEAGDKEPPRRRGLHRARSSSFSSWHVPGESDGSEGQGQSEKDHSAGDYREEGEDQRRCGAGSSSGSSCSGSAGQEEVELAQQGLCGTDGQEGEQQDGISFPAHCVPRTCGDAAVCSDGTPCGDCVGGSVQPPVDAVQAAPAAGRPAGTGVTAAGMPVRPSNTSEGAEVDDSAAAARALTRRLFARLASEVAEPLSSSAGRTSSGARGMQLPGAAAEGDAGQPVAPPPRVVHGVTPAGAVVGETPPPAAAPAAPPQPAACECAACISGLATTRWGEWGQEEQQLLHARRREVAAAVAARAGEGRASQDGGLRSLWEALGGVALEPGPQTGAGAGDVELSPVTLLRAMIHHLNTMQWQKVGLADGLGHSQEPS